MTQFSIIIPAYNAADTIGDTLATITAQLHTQWEAFVIDDGSTDGTRQVVECWERNDPRIRLVRNPGKGPSDARNHGALDLATGEVLAFCDADDLWSHTKLAEINEALADPRVDATFGQIAFFRHASNDARTFSTVPQTPVTVEMLMAENPICTLSNLTIRRHVFARAGGFDPQMSHNEDLEFLIRIVGSGACVQGLDSLQVWYRTSGGGLSSDLPAMQASRDVALQTAKRFGYRPTRAVEAVYFRYLARRALRLDLGKTEAARLTLRGLSLDPRAFCSPAKRGVLTAVGACAALVLPSPMRRALFSH
ncbi:MAG: glycosyltransferase family 2 protein [Thalassovita sp.]